MRAKVHRRNLASRRRMLRRMAGTHMSAATCRGMTSCRGARPPASWRLRRMSAGRYDSARVVCTACSWTVGSLSMGCAAPRGLWRCRPSGLALIPPLERKRIMRFVDEHKLKSAFVMRIKERQRQRRVGQVRPPANMSTSERLRGLRRILCLVAASKNCTPCACLDPGVRCFFGARRSQRSSHHG